MSGAPAAGWRLLHLSDPHFGTEQPALVQALLDWARQHRPQLVVLSGDVTQRARAGQFAAARRFVDALCDAAGIDARRDVLVIPGNHDLPLILWAWRRLGDPWRGFRAAFGPALEPVIERPGLCLLGVNTTRRWRHARGVLSAAQRQRLAARLRAAPAGALKIVVTHQPIHVQDAADRGNRLRGHVQAAQALAAAGADLLLAGHTHLAFCAPLRTQWPALAHDTWAVQSGTATSSRTRAPMPNSFHVIDSGLAGARCQVTRWDWDAAALAWRVAAAQRIA